METPTDAPGEAQRGPKPIGSKASRVVDFKDRR